MAIVVYEPIVSSPFAEPTRHYRMRGGRPELAEARRRVGEQPRRGTERHRGLRMTRLPQVAPMTGAILYTTSRRMVRPARTMKRMAKPPSTRRSSWTDAAAKP